MRRSSTARSIGARSDFDSDEGDARSTAGSVFPDNPDRAKEKDEADAHMNKYVSDQLSRIKGGNEDDAYDNSEEYVPK